MDSKYDRQQARLRELTDAKTKAEASIRESQALIAEAKVVIERLDDEAARIHANALPRPEPQAPVETPSTSEGA